MITGENKRSVLDQIINKKGDWEKYPTAYIVPTNAESEMIYFLDTAASPLD